MEVFGNYCEKSVFQDSVVVNASESVTSKAFNSANNTSKTPRTGVMQPKAAPSLPRFLPTSFVTSVPISLLTSLLTSLFILYLLLYLLLYFLLYLGCILRTTDGRSSVVGRTDGRNFFRSVVYSVKCNLRLQ